MVRSASVVEECESLLRSPPRAEVSQRRAIGTFARPERSLSSGTDRVVITMLGLIAIVGSAVVVGAVVMIKHHDRARTCAVVVGAALVWISVRTVKSAGVGLSRICLRADYASVLAGEALAVGTYAVVTIGAVAWNLAADQPPAAPIACVDHGGWARRGCRLAAPAFIAPWSTLTIKTHVARVLDKLDLRDRTQAVVLAYETGIVRPGEDQPHLR